MLADTVSPVNSSVAAVFPGPGIYPANPKAAVEVPADPKVLLAVAAEGLVDQAVPS